MPTISVQVMMVIAFITAIPDVRCIYLNVTSQSPDAAADNPAQWTEDEGVWTPLLEQWVLRDEHGTHREERVMKLPPPQDGYVTTTRLEQRPPPKVINNNIGAGVAQRPYDRPGSAAGTGTSRPISETDLYLLAAMEKLVYRADFMEKRLRRVEEMLHYVMAGSRMDREPCPENFTRAGTRCYHFADLAGREKDWKAAKFGCKRLGAVLAEMETIEENQDVVAHIQTNSNLRGKDFWTGGLNPGLLWIWSNSARPVSATNNNTSSSQMIKGEGRCLRLAYDPALRHYAYRGSDCSARYQYICELPADRTVNDNLTRLARKLDL